MVGPGRPPIEYQFKPGNPGRPKGVETSSEKISFGAARRSSRAWRDGDREGAASRPGAVPPIDCVSDPERADPDGRETIRISSDDELNALALDLARQIVADAGGEGAKALPAPLSDEPPLTYLYDRSRGRPQTLGRFHDPDRLFYRAATAFTPPADQLHLVFDNCAERVIDHCVGRVIEHRVFRQLFSQMSTPHPTDPPSSRHPEAGSFPRFRVPAPARATLRLCPEIPRRVVQSRIICHPCGGQ